jgi:CheY-like chemotaxis protein
MREALRTVASQPSLRVVSDGDEALRYLRRQAEHAEATRPSLIFMDLNLPRFDARDVLRQLKNDPHLRTIPIAVLTSSDADRDVREVYELHANCYLRKPVDLDDYLSKVRQTIHFWLNIAEGTGD